MSMVGVMIGAVSVGFFKLAAFGVDPFQSFMSGTHQMFPINFGTLYVIVNALLLLFALIFDRHYIGIATFINLFLLGYVVQFSYDTLLSIFPDASMMVRIPSFIFGFVARCFGCSVYITETLAYPPMTPSPSSWQTNGRSANSNSSALAQILPV